MLVNYHYDEAETRQMATFLQAHKTMKPNEMAANETEKETSKKEKNNACYIERQSMFAHAQASALFKRNQA